MRLIPSRLKGHARLWYDTRQRLAVTWIETKELLRQQFRKEIPFSRLFREAALYESSPGQSLGDYCFQKLNKLRKLDINIADKYLVDAVIGGIVDARVARTVRAAQHTNPNSLYAYMTTLGNMPFRSEKGKTFALTNKSERKGESADGSQKGHAQTASEPNTSTNGRTNDDSNNNKPRIECFNCGKSGHIARKCRKPRVECDRCNRLGHLGEKCPHRKDVYVVERLGGKLNMSVR
ncbi:uncharacterized protein [Mycetomoellerius zeteki]|uniref:uncharacterized protein n=1 Tax=Mycetomoellerius zeteki TaxID=64791 RepID=UPI00084E8B27|nr:PREDICTED: uncharacterized protein LOC108729034 [Trachymyrmex zeteki]